MWKIVPFLFLVRFIFELLSIFMVMINIVKIKWINASENCLLNIFSVRIFSHWIIPYLSYSHLVETKAFKYDMDKHIV